MSFLLSLTDAIKSVIHYCSKREVSVAKPWPKIPELPRPMTELQQTYLIISDPLSDICGVSSAVNFVSVNYLRAWNALCDP
jgi:hypothetical protein